MRCQPTSNPANRHGDAITPQWIAGLVSESIKIVQAPRLTMILYEAGNFHRQICTDGRKLPEEVNLPVNGYSAGHWQGQHPGGRDGWLQ
jgi:hypothetical protein